ncbi:uncharacterized protein C12orf56 [Strongylocentrotus purpuratus]|uniref:Uncharacterized protein n=1 Tax=Strongylocentrotus purpuratus TaxID=7668 RepID=A0A7M7LPC5_STRPU|nr:uncharacterized protein C12orf56 [Strongylocentrotus purpuratus]
MARNVKEITTKRNSKLESFLKINLPESAYERIIAYEPCIVDHRKEKKAFKYVVLSAERIYLTENPPKTIREEDGVQLGELISVELVNEFPEFLNGEERDNCQHIFIKYHAKKSSKHRKKGGGDKHGNGLDEGSSSGGSSPLPELILTEPNGSTLDPSQHPSRSSSMRSLKLNRSLDESDLKSLRDMSIDSDSDSEDRLSWSMPSGDLENMSIHSLESLSLGSGEMLTGDKGKGKITGVETCRPLPHRPPINRGQRQRSIDKPESFSSQIASSLENREANAPTSPPGSSTSSKSQLRNLPSPEPSDTDKSKSKPFQFPSSEKEGTKKGLYSHIPLLRHKSLDEGVSSSYSKIDNKENRSAEDFLKEHGKQNEEEMHLYIISLSSPMLMHLRSSWNNHIIKTTLLTDQEITERLKPGTGSSKGPSRAQLERKFAQLKQEILNSGFSMEKLFSLVQELLTAAEKYFVLKKLFWKQPDLFNFFLAQLQRYLPKSTVNVHTEKGKQHRADELELVILLNETLGLMFHETEVLPGRLDFIKANSGKAALDLLVVLTCLPEIPQRWRPPRTKAQSLGLVTDTDSWKTYADSEVAKLVQELTNASTVVLFELILIAHQSNWGNGEGKFFNICWLVRVLETMQSTLLDFVTRVLAQAMKLLMPSRHEMLTPSDAVLLFQQFFVIQTLLEYSPQVSVYVRNNYNEEFRYYVQSPHIVKKLPKLYPITPQTLRIIDEVLSHVLQKPASLLTKKPKKK